jgi:hypothetical protein
MLTIASSLGNARSNAPAQLRRRTFGMLLLLLPLAPVVGHALESGQAIPVGSADGLGPLAAPGVVSYPLGAAQVVGTEQPELFLRTTKYGIDTGLWMYPAAGYTSAGVPIFNRR